MIDYQILGGDSAGCVLAARLSEDAGKTVSLVVARRDISQATMHADIRSRYPGRVYLGRPYRVHTVRCASSAQPHRVYRHCKGRAGHVKEALLFATRGLERPVARLHID